MEHELENTISLLSRSPSVFNALLRDLPEIWTLRNEGKDTWSAFDVVEHLNDSERINWIARTKFLLQFGEARTFEPFDRFEHIRKDQDVQLRQLLDEFSQLRSESLIELRALNLRPEDLALRGRHPVFGVITLSELLATWVVHDLTHLHQISRIMAHQYRDAVGPWTRYLGVLKCAGHSSD